MRKYIYLLKNINLFKGISAEEVYELLDDNNCRITGYKKNSVVYIQNEKCYNLDVIISGIISVQKIDSQGRIFTINDFTAGDVLGGNLLFSVRNTYPMTIVTKSECKILHIGKAAILKLCQSNAIFLENFLQAISDKTLLLADKIDSMSMKTVRQLIIQFLIYEYYLQKSLKITLGITKKELAERFGIQRPSLSRELNKMRKEGLIEFDAQTITIKSLDSLIDFKD